MIDVNENNTPPADSQGQLTVQLYRAAKALKKDNPDEAAIIRKIARLVEDSNVEDIADLEDLFTGN